MRDLDKRLDKIEQQLQIITNNLLQMFGIETIQKREELNLEDILSIIWKGKLWIVALTFLFALAGIFYALNLPNIYKSEGVYAPAQKQGGNTFGGQLGGLASIAGVNLRDGESKDIDQAMALIKSWSFLEQIVEKEDLGPLVLGLTGWNKNTGDLIWNNEIYDVNRHRWLTENVNGKKSGPTSYEIYNALSKMIEANIDSKTGMIKISVIHYSPNIAEKWVHLLVNSLNNHFQQRAIVDAKRNIKYLENQIAETKLAEMQSVFYGMIEAQLKTLMLAEVGDEYLLKEIIPPKVPEKKFKPSKTIICILFTIVGAGLSSIVVLIVGLVKKDN